MPRAQEYVLCRILNLRDIHSVLAVQLKKNQHHTIGLVTSSRTYYVRAETAAEMESWIRALNETRRALAERDEWAERQDERRRAAGKQPSEQQQQQAVMVDSLAGMSLGQAASSAHAESTEPSHAHPHAHVRAAAAPSAPIPAGHELETYGMTPVVSGLLLQPPPGVAGGIITSSESEDDAHGCDVARGTDLSRTMEIEPRQGTSHAFSPGGGASPVVGLSHAAAPIQTDPHKVILSGYLTKLGNKRKTWRKRWFVLTSGELVYTKSHMASLGVFHRPGERAF